jgi:hypothetical protein
MAMRGSYGYQFRPLDQGAMEYRVEREKIRTGKKDQFDREMSAREVYIDERPDVVVNDSLVFIDKRPADSNWFKPRREREWMNRLPIIGGQRQEFGVENATPARPIVTQASNFQFNREQINRTSMRKAL